MNPREIIIKYLIDCRRFEVVEGEREKEEEEGERERERVRKRERKGSTQRRNEMGKGKANDTSRFMKWNRFPWFHIIILQNSIHS